MDQKFKNKQIENHLKNSKLTYRHMFGTSAYEFPCKGSSQSGTGRMQPNSDDDDISSTLIVDVLTKAARLDIIKSIKDNVVSR